MSRIFPDQISESEAKGDAVKFLISKRHGTCISLYKFNVRAGRLAGFIKGERKHILVQIKAGYTNGSFGRQTDAHGQITGTTAEIKDSFRITAETGINGMPAPLPVLPEGK
jgi:hypothetical protein